MYGRSRSLLRRAHGFTLIEIMIVLAIVAILALIIIPNNTRSRARANVVSCKENLKTMAAAVHMFASDNEGRLPFQGWVVRHSSGGTVPANSMWSLDIFSQGDTSEPNFVPKYVPKVMRCPGSYRNLAANSAGYYYLLSYSYNGSVGWGFCIYCTQDPHRGAGIPSGFPSYVQNYRGRGQQDGLNEQP